MKTVFVIIIAFCSLVSNGQQNMDTTTANVNLRIENINKRLHSSKKAFIFSGLTMMAGAAFNLYANTLSAPDPSMAQTPQGAILYQSELNDYNNSRKKATTTGAILMGISGLTTIFAVGYTF